MPRIPVKDLAEVAKRHRGKLAVLVIYDGDSTHVVSWGDTVHNCDRAAQLSEHLKKAMGWPEKLWSTIPSRVAKLHRLIGDVVREAESEKIPCTECKPCADGVSRRPHAEAPCPMCGGSSFSSKWGKFKKDLTERVKKIKEPAGES